ncbi:hypothetical protein D9613_003755 [Agrocybe pediades]|uniref:Phospholipase D/nuclease n=1 Tax=Agrocybe pediades TaxID=84607 RepID=A0A8H4QJ66_9AGAR|nr:hypothetical protein D9613_003755 [Agrocybe pediades]
MSNEDDDLARAIALSLEESQRNKQPALVNLDSDEDEDTEEARFQAELQEAIRVSQAAAEKNPRPTAQKSTAGSSTQPSQPGKSSDQPTGPVSSFLSERAKLEKERLERQKRLRPPSPVAAAESTTEGESDEEEPPAKRHKVSSSNVSHTRSNIHGISSSSASTSAIPTAEQLFWQGELRQTATRNAEPRKDGQPTFRLTDVLGKTSELAFAIMSSYALDFPWIYQFFEPSVPVIMVAQPDASGEATIKNVLPNWIRTTPFLRGGFGCQHMKFMLSVWLQDIPLRSKPIPHDPNPKLDDFAAVLQRMLDKINVKPALAAMIKDNVNSLAYLPLKSIEELRQKWDWTNVKVHLVASIAGKHEGWDKVIQTGHPRLLAAVRKMGMRTGRSQSAKDVVLECQGSSLGLYTTQWLNEFHYSARGESAEDWLDGPKKAREKLPLPSVKIVFPTKATVQKSALGEQGGGTIFCRRKQWSGKNFPRHNFYDSKSKAGPVLMHSKMIIAMLKENNNKFTAKKHQPSDSEDDEIEVVEPGVGWAYVGSHNFTPSAWGTLSGNAFNPILNISNYEVGVVFLLKDAGEADRVACFQRPPKKYSQTDEPWMQEESVHHKQ